jgi:hypothetical protein
MTSKTKTELKWFGLAFVTSTIALLFALWAADDFLNDNGAMYHKNHLTGEKIICMKNC